MNHPNAGTTPWTSAEPNITEIPNYVYRRTERKLEKTILANNIQAHYKPQDVASPFARAAGFARGSRRVIPPTPPFSVPLMTSPTFGELTYPGATEFVQVIHLSIDSVRLKIRKSLSICTFHGTRHLQYFDHSR